MEIIKGDSQTQEQVSIELPEYHAEHLKRLRSTLEIAERNKSAIANLKTQIAQLEAESNQIRIEVNIGSDTIIKMALADANLSGRKFQVMPNLKDVLVY
jgi:hypothetical protein